LSNIRVAVSLKTYGDVVTEQAAVDGDGIAFGVRVEGLDAAEIRRQLAEADALLVTNDLLDSRVVDSLPESVRIIVRGGSGLDAIDLDAAQRRGIAVANTPGYATDEVAGHALAMILACARSLGPADRVARTSWDWSAVPTPLRLADARLGVIGGGRIGSRVAEMARELFAEVLVFDPFANPEIPGVAHAASLEQLLESSDIVTLHVALSAATHHILDEAAMRRLPAGARVVNASRGGLVDEIALATLLADGHIACAALDVLEQEPPASDASILMSERVLLSPHIGWASPSSGARARTMSTKTALEFLTGLPLTCGTIVVDPGVPK
jgi:phosphoglycerate dehydrogenase-like enzyme